MLRTALVAAASLFSATAIAGSISFNNGSGFYTAPDSSGVTATVSVTTARSQDGLYYNGVEDAIGVGSSLTTGGMGYKSGPSFSCGFIGCFTEDETITVTFNQQVTVDTIYMRQWENNVLGFGDEVNFTSNGGDLLFDESDGKAKLGLVDSFDTGVTLTSFTLTPEQDGRNGTGAKVRTSVYLHSLDFTVSQVPLPAAAYLFGSALVGLIAVGRRRRPSV